MPYFSAFLNLPIVIVGIEAFLSLSKGETNYNAIDCCAIMRFIPPKKGLMSKIYYYTTVEQVLP